MKSRICLMLWMLSFLLPCISYDAKADNVCCERPTLPALAGDAEYDFYQYRDDIAHGEIRDVTYKHNGVDKNMRIYFPPDYDSSTRSYPVLYLSHGMGGDEYGWTYGGYADYILDNLIADGKAGPMIIVMPHWQGGNDYFGLNLGLPAGTQGLEPMPPGIDDVVTRELTEEIIPFVESNYRAKPDRLYRAIAGLSLGGYVTLNTGLRRLDLFSEIFLYSSFYNNVSLVNPLNNFDSILKDSNISKERLTVPLYLAVGDADMANILQAYNSLCTIMSTYDINHYEVLSSGGHEWMNWRRYLHQTAQIMFPNCAANHSFTLSPEEASKASTVGKDIPNTQTGYAKLVMDSGSTPYGTAVFMFKKNGVTISEVGVPASPPTTHARVFIDYRSDVPGVPSRTGSGAVDINTGIAIINAGHNTAHITYSLLGTNGSPIAEGHGTLDVGKHFGKFINQLHEAAPDFVLPDDFQFASLDIESDQPLSVTALRMTVNQREEALFTTTPVADLTEPVTDTPLYFPQLADGDGWTTSLILLNTSGSEETGSFRIFDKTGALLEVHQVGGITASSFEYSIPVDGAYHFQTDGSSEGLVGWVQLVPDSLNSTPIGSGVFSLNPEDVMTSEAGIPSVALSTTHARIFVDLTENHNTGLAIANPDPASNEITVQAFQTDGVTPVGQSQGPVQLAGFGHESQFANQLISGLPGDFNGILDISASSPFAAITVRTLYNEREDFLTTTFPVADVTRPAPSPIVFPQIADGGGYVSQFILLNPDPEAASDSSLILYDDNGILFAAGEEEHKIE
jgi:enterochelin esterase-like enzyme